MENLTNQQVKDQLLKAEVYQRTHVEAAKCYQCGKCSGGCPVAEQMDIMPRQVMRLLQLGLVEEALHSKAIWLCAGCDTCSTRCPKGVDIAKVMETLRIMAKERGYITEKNIDKFHNIYIGLMKGFGRMYEPGLIVGRNVMTGHLLQDFSYGIPYLAKRKLNLMPYRPKAKDEIAHLFQTAEKVHQEELAKLRSDKGGDLR